VILMIDGCVHFYSAMSIRCLCDLDVFVMRFECVLSDVDGLLMRRLRFCADDSRLM